MRVVTTLPQQDLRLVPEAARAAEQAGFDGLISMENQHDPFLPLAVAATVTERVQLATSIAISFARSPMVAANVGWDLQKASTGRFSLGLGSQIRPHNERRFSVPWSPPAPRMREYVQAIRAIWRCWGEGEKLDFRGEHYTFTLMTPAFTPPPLDTPPPVITIAAVGSAMLRVAGEVCDGVRLHPFNTRRYSEKVIGPRLQAGFDLCGRRREDFEISGGGFVATGASDDEVAAMVETVRKRIGFYASTPAYWPVLEQHDLEDLGKELNALSKQGRWDDMTAAVSDDLLHLMCAVGRHDQLAAALAERFAGVTDVITVATPLPPDLIQDIQRL
jgi:probable F420-dependent oxidoreductase